MRWAAEAAAAEVCFCEVGHTPSALWAWGKLPKELSLDSTHVKAWRMHVTDEQGATVCILTIKGTTEEA